MVILTGAAIGELVANGQLIMDPFDERHINPNSYNVHLANELLLREYGSASPDFRKVKIPADGYILRPRTLCLGATAERFGGDGHVTCLISRSSAARLGLFVQLNADMGNLGAIHAWTLELYAVQPLVLYPFMRIAQVMFWHPTGDRTLYRGDYAKHDGPRPCGYPVGQMVVHDDEQAAVRR
ncbi:MULTISPECIES: dCTP deaminase domain-containing protein [unclassified Streptomyces]|uniref:dCTP deaminase n=1 Tax=unclassified Streptomyces TaxID=2593676 RepID=UPI003864B069